MNKPNNQFDNLIDNLESSLKSFISIYNIELIENKSNQEHIKKQVQNEQNKTNIENSANDLYEKAQSLESMFLKYRLELSKNAPDQLLKEDIECLKAEVKRKDDLLSDTKEKIAACENDLRSILNK